MNQSVWRSFSWRHGVRSMDVQEETAHKVELGPAGASSFMVIRGFCLSWKNGGVLVGTESSIFWVAFFRSCICPRKKARFSFLEENDFVSVMEL